MLKGRIAQLGEWNMADERFAYCVALFILIQYLYSVRVLTCLLGALSDLWFNSHKKALLM